MKAAIHLQAKPSWLWGSIMCRRALSVWGHFSTLGFYLCFCLVVWVFFFSCCCAGCAGCWWGPGCQEQWGWAVVPGYEPKPSTHGSDLLADGRGYPSWDTAPCWLGSPLSKGGFLVGVVWVGRAVCVARL